MIKLHDCINIFIVIFMDMILIIGTPYQSAVDFWHSSVWDFEFDELDFFSNLIPKYQEKNPVPQIPYFKLENVKTQK